MRFVTLAVLMLLGLSAHMPSPDYGPFKAIETPVSKWGHKNPALIYVPDNGGKPGEKYPLIVCFHGKSIAGNDLTKLFKEGVPRQLFEGKKIEAVHPTEKKLYKFIVLAPLAKSWSLDPEGLSLTLNDVMQRFPIDPHRIYITGYSAGGWSTAMAMTHKGLAQRIAAAVPMSPSLIDEAHLNSFKVMADANVYAWMFVGLKEPHWLENTRRYRDSANKYKPGLARISYTETAHCCWAPIYNPAYRENGKSIYEWMLLFRK